MTTPDPDGALERRTPDYRSVIRKLTQLDDEAATHRGEAHDWHDTRAAETDAAVDAAERRVAETHAEARAAQRRLEEVDAEVATLWAEFSAKAGRLADRFGGRPQPAVPRQRDRAVEDYLQEAVTTAAWTPAVKPLRAATLLYIGIGALGGAVGLAAWSLIRWAGRESGGDLAAGLPVVALVVALLGPVLAVVTAKRVADRGDTPLDASTVVTVLGSALVTAGLILAVVRNSTGGG